LVVLVGLVGAVLLVGQSLHLPKFGRLGAKIDLVLGISLLVLVVVAQVFHLRRSPRGSSGGSDEADGSEDTKRQAGSPRGAFGLGVASMAANFTTAALVVVASKDISASTSGPVARGTGVVTVLVFGSLPAWAPILVAAISPKRGLVAIQDFSGWVHRNGRTLSFVLVAAVGAYLIYRGAARLG
jgi:hypothetical protein